MKKFTSVLVASAIVLSACATHPDKIDAAYVSSVRYDSHSCDQLADRLAEVESRVERLTGHQVKKNRQDKWATGVGLVLFWPSLFWLATDDVKQELQQAKGEHEAIMRVAQEKGCF